MQILYAFSVKFTSSFSENKSRHAAEVKANRLSARCWIHLLYESLVLRGMAHCSLKAIFLVNKHGF